MYDPFISSSISTGIIFSFTLAIALLSLLLFLFLFLLKFFQYSEIFYILGPPGSFFHLYKIAQACKVRVRSTNSILNSATPNVRKGCSGHMRMYVCLCDVLSEQNLLFQQFVYRQIGNVIT